MSAIYLPAAKHRAYPWKNGLGVSYTIADFPHDAGFDAVLWQVSSTEIVADCPFSNLPGLDRQFMVIEGAGVELKSIDDHGATRTTPVKVGQLPYAFHGDWKTDCRLLGGPVRVLNVICRRGKAAATVAFLDAKSLTKTSGEIAIAVHLASLDAWMLSGPGKESASIEPHQGPVVLIRITA